uniref:Serine racemase n=1 Tax=Schistocephalus solidus TaxID=70667 RepID=A0A0X3P1C3_SCHSO
MIEEIDLEIPDENDPEVFDPECDPNNPRAIDFHQVLEAVERIKGIIQPTTCVRSRLSDRYGLELYFKKEFEHLTGSFKERGACNTLSAFTSEQKRIGAISASTGNHSSAMALHAKKLGIPVTVVMPTITPLPKINNCLAFGAKIILKGKTISEARRVALKLAHQHGYTYVNGYLSFVLIFCRHSLNTFDLKKLNFLMLLNPVGLTNCNCYLGTIIPIFLLDRAPSVWKSSSRFQMWMLLLFPLVALVSLQESHAP